MVKSNPSKLGGKKLEFNKASINLNEKKLAKELGGRRQPNSGSLAHRKGDIVVGSFLLDSKECKGSKLNLDVSEIVKIVREALEVGKIPGLLFTFGDTSIIMPTQWACIPLSDFKVLLENFR